MIGLVLMLVILVAANAILSGTRLRKDLTEEKLYTLSDGTRQILSKMEQPLTLKLFFNFSMPELPSYLKQYAQQVQDLLREYEIAGDGKITVEVHDPKPDSDTEDWAQKYGIPGQQMGIGGPNVYFGIVAVSGEHEAALPVIDPRADQLLEYNLTRLIYRVEHATKPVVGVMSSLSVLGAPKHPMAPPTTDPSQKPWAAFNELRNDYDVREVATDVEKIDDDISALVVVHPKDLSETTLFALDQFVLRGGRLLVFLDPFCLTEIEAATAKDPFGMGLTPSDLNRLLTTWGVSYQLDRVAVDLEAPTPVRSSQSQVEENPMWLSLTRKNTSQKDILTAQLESIQMPFAGCFNGASSDKLTLTPLITTSPNAGAVSAMAARMGGDAIRREFRNGAIALNLAARLNGTFTTAFPGGKPAPAGVTNAPPVDTNTPSLKEGKSTVVLVADVDMLYDRFCLQEMNFFGFAGQQPINDNVIFLANAVEQIAGSEDLIGIRSRGKFSRPFDRVLALEQKARNAWQEREKELEAKLQDTQRQVNEMQARKDSSQRFILSPEQKQALDKFRQDEIRVKAELKTVRKSLRRDIEVLGAWVKVINIALMPLGVAVCGIGYYFVRRQKK